MEKMKCNRKTEEECEDGDKEVGITWQRKESESTGEGRGRRCHVEVRKESEEVQKNEMNIDKTIE